MLKKILIIEDNADIRENTAEMLELSNYKVLVAENGSIGFRMAQQHEPDIILCDIMMPESDGRWFLKLAKADEIVRTIPLIFFSAGSIPPDERALLLKQADSYLPKPFTENELLDAIKNAL